jgi:RecA/RadA recombinase
MSILERMKKSGSIKGSVLSNSDFFGEKQYIKTDLPILNVAYSGRIEGGLVPGVTIIAGESKSFKTMLMLYSMRSFLNHDPEAIAILYDSEFGITPEYLESLGIDTDRVLHIPIEDIEQFKFDLMSRFKDLTKKDKVFIGVDSIGNLASKKEVEDAENEKSVADMTRAKSFKSLFRMITPKLTTLGIPFVAIAHIYQTQELYAKNVVSGGKGIMYAANTVFIVTKAQEKDGKELSGWNFTINIEKSRYVREKAKLPFQVLYDSGIQKPNKAGMPRLTWLLAKFLSRTCGGSSWKKTAIS